MDLGAEREGVADQPPGALMVLMPATSVVRGTVGGSSCGARSRGG